MRITIEEPKPVEERQVVSLKEDKLLNIVEVFIDNKVVLRFWGHDRQIFLDNKKLKELGFTNLYGDFGEDIKF